MKILIKIAMPVLILVVAIGFASFLMMARPVAEQIPVEAPLLLVDSFEAQPVDVMINVKVSGTVTPYTETTLVSEVSGRIIRVAPGFKSGGYFSAGDIILQIDPRNHDAELKRTEAALVRARIKLSQEESLAKHERGDYERLKTVDPNQLSTSDLSFRSAQIAQAMADVVAAEAQLIKAQGDVDRTFIRMPYDGLIREKRADLGQYVNPGTPIGVMFAVDYAEVRLPLTPSQVRDLPLPTSTGGLPIPVQIKSVDAERSWSGRLVRTEGTLDPTSRTLYAIARVEDPYGIKSAIPVPEPLRIGTYVDVVIPGKRLESVFALERHMVKPGNRVWVIDEDSRIQSRVVSIAYADPKHAWIDGGLSPGERICVTPVDNPLPGTRVRVVADGA
ncbi:MAG: efflux RND transporter periplasmic adaptor subunit [Pseudomonadales bacterium]|nr:efflux RND transporter periplasmic adaptor subunit [Pseudomonadales bacterium]